MAKLKTTEALARDLTAPVNAAHCRPDHTMDAAHDALEAHRLRREFWDLYEETREKAAASPVARKIKDILQREEE